MIKIQKISNGNKIWFGETIMEDEAKSDSKLDRTNNAGESKDIFFIFNRLHVAWSTFHFMWTRPNPQSQKR